MASEPEEALRLEERGGNRARMVPHVTAWLLAGQDRYSSRTKSIGLASLNAAASTRISDSWGAIPSYQGFYQATRQTLDVGERVILIQARMDHRLAGKLIWGESDSRTKIKFSAGARYHLLSETKDEPWGKGLFDYRKYSAGIECEYVFRRPYDSIRISYDHYRVDFPNYQTLESRGALQIDGKPVARELVGGRVLNSEVHAALLGLSGRIGDAFPWDVFYVSSLHRFPEQHLIDARDQFAPSIRHDVNHDFNASLRATHRTTFGALRKLRGGLRTAYAWTDSNQNSFNVADSRFFPEYYDYREWRLAPNIAAQFSNLSSRRDDVQTALSWELTSRLYPHRPAQDSLGAYSTASIKTTTQVFGLSINWPVSKYLSLMVSYRNAVYSSNMKYERFSRYNDSGQTYLAGFGYEL